METVITVIVVGIITFLGGRYSVNQSLFKNSSSTCKKSTGNSGGGNLEEKKNDNIK